MFDKEFKEYLSVRKNGDDLEKRMTQHFRLCQTNTQVTMSKMTKMSRPMTDIVIVESIDDFAATMAQQILQNLINTVKIECQTLGIIGSRDINQRKKWNNVDWKFNYCQRNGFDDIYDNGKTFRCSYGFGDCQGFSRVSFGMKPNSGIYKIRFKINKINSDSCFNAIGIICNTHPTNNSQSKHNYWYNSHDYIAWSSFENKGEDIILNVPNGLICGGGNKYQSRNIFVLSNFKYMSNNISYLRRLPGYKSGDIIEMLYDSSSNSLTFFKSNNKLLNSKIIHLPKEKTFYWIVGHDYGQIFVTIVK